MPFDIPTLAETRGLNRDYLSAKLPGSEAAPPNSRAAVLSDANAGLAYLNFLYLAWLSQQFLPDTAESEWLDRHGQIWLGGRLAGTYATGSVTVTGTAGTVLPSGTRLSVGGVEYETTEEITVGSEETEVEVTALAVGVLGNQPAGVALSLIDAVAGVDASATVVDITGGVDTESDDSLRDRVLFRIRKPPMGGAAHDYIAWARSFPGVTRAWSAPLEAGIGTVTVRFMMDELRATSSPLTDGFPVASDVEMVAEYLDALRPVAVRDFFVFAPVPHPIDFDVDDLVPDTSAIRAAINANVKAMIDDRAEPGATMHAEWISAAILNTPGVESFTLLTTDRVMPSGGHLAVMGTATYV